FTPVPHSANSSVVAAPLSVRADGLDASTLTVTVKDVNGDAITDLAEDDFIFDGESNASIGGFDDTGAASGVYTFRVTNTVPESVTISVIVDGINLGA